MLRLGRILACVVLISVVVLSSCAQEEDPYATMYDPLVALTEKLQLTDEQVETVETGTWHSLILRCMRGSSLILLPRSSAY